MNHNDSLRKVYDASMIEHMGKWYSWDSPIGLSIFLISLALVVVFITLVIYLIHLI